MFGLGPTELVVILVLGLIVLGPQRIPEVAASLGKAIRSFRKATKELRDQIDIDDEVRRPFEDLRAALRDDPPPLPPFVPPPYLSVVPPTEPIVHSGHGDHPGHHDHHHDQHHEHVPDAVVAPATETATAPAGAPPVIAPPESSIAAAVSGAKDAAPSPEPHK